MFQHLSLESSAATATTPTSTTVSSSTTTPRVEAAAFDADSSDTDSNNTTAAVIFPTASKNKNFTQENFSQSKLETLMKTRQKSKNIW